jgi:hypothetical protein
MEKILVMIKDLQNLWSDILDVTTTEGRNIDTFEKAKVIIESNYVSDLTNWNIVEEGNEIYIYADQDIPCKNCP